MTNSELQAPSEIASSPLSAIHLLKTNSPYPNQRSLPLPRQLRMSSNGSGYTPPLRHASSAGGTSTNDEGWKNLSWYGDIHKLSMSERTEVGIGMSLSQKQMWLMVSTSAWKQAVFPDHYFDNFLMLQPDVDNTNIWFLLHEITRHTYASLIKDGVTMAWSKVPDGPLGKKWNLWFMLSDHIGFVQYSHWRGNTAQQAEDQLLERFKGRTRHEPPRVVPTSSASRKNPSTSNYTDVSKAAHDHDTNTFEDIASRLKQEATELDGREAALSKVENDTCMRTNNLMKQTAGLDRRAKTLSKAEFQIGVHVTELDHKQVDLDERETILAEAEHNNTMRTELLDKKAADLDEREEAIIVREKSAVTAGESMIGLPSSAGPNL